MVAKKYLSLEEAASVLGVTTDELIRSRERGEVRGFADRGTWKFKSEDVAELKRRRQTDSSPEVPLLEDEDEAETLMGNPPRQEFASSVFDEDEGVNESETIVRKGPKPASDSDVRLVLGDPSSRLSGSSADLPVMSGPGSDSDIRLVGEDLSHIAPRSDSDVKLIGSGDSSSEVELIDSDSDVRLTAGSDSDVKLVDSTAGDSGISLVSSGSLFDEDDSITLPGDSGIRLAGDSGIGTRRPADSGISLEGSSKFLAGDSGLRLGGDSSFKLSGGSNAPTLPDLAMSDASDDEFGATSAMYSLKEDASGGTDVEVPLLDDDDTYKIPSLSGGGRTGDTSVIMFDDEEMSGEAGSAVELDEDDIDEIEVAEDVLGEDDELEDLEVFGADDEDFDDDLASGASHAEFVAGNYGMKLPAREVEWGGGTFALLGVSTVALILATVMGADLLQSVFAGGQTYSGLAGTVGGMLGN